MHNLTKQIYTHLPPYNTNIDLFWQRTLGVLGADMDPATADPAQISVGEGFRN